MANEKTIDVPLFIEIILSVEGVSGPYSPQDIDGYRIEAYIGPKGRSLILVSDEFMTITAAHHHCRKLGLDNLIGKLG